MKILVAALLILLTLAIVGSVDALGCIVLLRFGRGVLSWHDQQAMLAIAVWTALVTCLLVPFLTRLSR